MKKVETLTINEALDTIRGYGIPMTYEKICAWADAGAVTWALSGEFKGAHYRTIFKKPLMEWLEGLAISA